MRVAQVPCTTKSHIPRSYDNPVLGSNHGSDLTAMFTPPAATTAAVNELLEDMREYWTSLVISGYPTAQNGTVWTVGAAVLILTTT